MKQYLLFLDKYTAKITYLCIKADTHIYEHI